MGATVQPELRPILRPLVVTVREYVSYGGSLPPVVEWTPVALFASNEQGMFYDFDDNMDVKLAFRRNRLLYTEQLSNAYWTKVNSTVTQAGDTDPFGGTNAWRLTDNATVGEHGIYRDATIPYTDFKKDVNSCYFKQGTARYVALTIGVSVSSWAIIVDLQTGTVTQSPAAPYGVFIENPVDAGNGWWRVSLKTEYASANTDTFYAAICSTGVWGGASYSGSGQYILMHGPQADWRTGVPSEYQKITDFNTEFMAAFPNHALFQDTNGVIPVTDVEQPLGLVLDKRKNIAFGSELVTNGTFDTDISGWSPAQNATLSLDSGALKILNIGGNFGQALPTVPLTITVGKTYLFTANVTAINEIGGAIVGRILCGGFADGSIPNGAVRRIFTATTTGNLTLYHASANGGAYSIWDNVSLKEIPGNHRTQTSTSAKPKWTARKNLQLYSEDLSNAAYRKTGITVALSPDGTFSDGKRGWLVTNDGSTAHNFDTYPTNYGFTTGRMVTNSFFIKNVNATMVRVRCSPSGGLADIDLSTLVVSGVGGSAVVNVEELGGGELRISMTAPWVDFTYFQISVDGTSASSAQAHITGIQSEYGPVVTPYQVVYTAADYNAIGFPKGCKYDGVDDFMSVPVDFSVSDKMSISMGVQKTSDAAAAVLVEHTANYNTNNGGMYVVAPDGPSTPSYATASRGTAAANAGQSSNTGNIEFPAPHRAVLTALHDIAGDLSRLRINAVAEADGVIDKGAGNFANSTLYFGRRGGTSLPFNGVEYNTTVIARAFTAPELTNIESFNATKSGVTL